ncbi:hypothetical protein SODALDRAFT_1976 [Sodiomyces alkalinus F11]|uniref:Uncharacterized protein n=1 Tax=Sodiomyces alkalinus (strain CBS 110278 / VKM F-3762 / F11) TaxID=1314773 RepID=A0A3N2Q511_SODAK|nr:hypothetical protein SODALDRAFT_1976 [Sodiomyces alkalinus F11]ROT41864.1 hypothetical protein SODALDRAFT_1976 [Sodiomyces alkalinus F11]
MFNSRTRTPAFPTQRRSRKVPILRPKASWALPCAAAAIHCSRTYRCPDMESGQLNHVLGKAPRKSSKVVTGGLLRDSHGGSVRKVDRGKCFRSTRGHSGKGRSLQSLCGWQAQQDIPVPVVTLLKEGRAWRQFGSCVNIVRVVLINTRATS